MNDERALFVLTPEHVPVKLVPAGLGSRFLALLVDAGLVFALSIAIFRLCSALLPGGIARALAATLTFVVTWGYHVLFETRYQGRSPGKRLTGLRVVDARGLPVTREQSFVRNVVRVLDFAPLFYGAGALVSLLDRHGRRLGDLAAGTVVVTEERPPLLGLPSAPARRFNSLRTPRLFRAARNRISLEEREFLVALCLRAKLLTPEVRFDLMERAAERYRRKLGIEEPELSGEALVRDLTALLVRQEE